MPFQNATIPETSERTMLANINGAISLKSLFNKASFPLRTRYLMINTSEKMRRKKRRLRQNDSQAKIRGWILRLSISREKGGYSFRYAESAAHRTGKRGAQHLFCARRFSGGITSLLDAEEGGAALKVVV